MGKSVIDLSVPAKVFDVPTTVIRNGIAYMGPDVRVNANDSNDAIQRVQESGLDLLPNPHFAPKEVKK